MAKATDSRNELKRLQKEMTALKSKLKAAEQKSKDSKKNWGKKQKSSQAEMKEKLAAAYQSGFTDGRVQAEKRETAWKKALYNAELKFEKEYTKKTPVAKAKKSGVKKKGKTRTATKKMKSSRAASTVKSLRTAKATKKRGRPSKQKAIKSRNESFSIHQGQGKFPVQEVE